MAQQRKPTTVAPTTANGNVDESIKAPEGLVWAGTQITAYFAWGLRQMV